MLVKRPPAEPIIAVTLRHWKRWWIFGSLVCLVILYSIGLFVAGSVYTHKLSKRAQVLLLDLGFRNPLEAVDLGILGLIKETPAAMGRFITPQTPLQKIERIHLDVKFEYIQKLHALRQVALSRGLIFESEREFVPASIRHRGGTLKAKIRLKGDLIDHIDSNRWSFRVHTKNGHLFGMSRFTLQHPKTRGFQAEPLYLESLKEQGVLVPRYFFVNVTLNGQDLGIMAVEEHFSRELLEAQQRREGPIIKFDETLMWEKNNSHNGAVDSGIESQPIVPFDGDRLYEDPALAGQLEIAIGLLKSYQQGQLPASEVFDVDLMASFIATAEVWGVRHGLETHNLRFYYNPITSRLEPVAYDSNPHHVWYTPEFTLSIHHRHAAFIRKILSNPEIWRRFVQRTSELAEELQKADRLTELKRRDARWMGILKQEFVYLQPFNFNFVVARLPQVVKALEQKDAIVQPPKDRKLRRIVQAYLITENGRSLVELHNLTAYPVVVTAITHTAEQTGSAIHAAKLLDQPPVNLPPTLPDASTDPVRLEFATRDVSLKDRIEVRARVVGQEQVYSSQAIRSYPIRIANPVPNVTIEEAVARHPFLQFDRTGDSLRIEMGDWIVNEPLVVPRGVALEIEAGARLRFATDAFLLAFGATRFLGTPQKPIILEGLDSSVENPWKGVAILATGDKSHWKSVVIRNTTGVSHSGWTLSAGTTFHNANVILDHVRFDTCHAEDQLNTIASRFQLNDVKFQNAASDAFDADFCTGEIIGGSLNNIGSRGGGDGIDVSGSRVVIQGTTFHNIADKSLSVGEQSTLTASDLQFVNVGVGIASKDDSTTQAENIPINTAKVAGFMAYMKKTEYNGGTIHVKQAEFSATPVRAISQTGSHITLNGKTVPEQNIDVDRLYKTIMSKETAQ